MPKINNKLLFFTNRYKPGMGLEEMPAELDASVCKQEKKPHPNFSGVVVHAALF